MRAPWIAIPVESLHSGQSEHFALGASYVVALRAAGGAPMLLPAAEESADLSEQLDAFAGLFLTGGADVSPTFYGQTATPHVREASRARDITEIALARAALERGLPVFGICRGIQLLCVAAGGTLHQDIQADLPDALDHRYQDGRPRAYPAHQVCVQADSRLAQILASAPGELLPVNSMHHQAVDTPPPGFAVVAAATDGVIEAIELDSGATQFALGVQWHPEELVPEDTRMTRLFAAFVQACYAWQQHA